MRVVFLVPRRADGGHRDALWDYAKARWQQYFPDWAIVEGHHDDGPFNRSAAVNLAASEAGDWDVGIVIDSDVLISKSLLEDAVTLAVETQKITWPHTRIRNIREDMTKRFVADRHDFGAEIDRDHMDLVVERTNPLSWSCCIVIPRSQYDALGGFDERFKGWGFEDMAFQSAVCGLLGWNRQKGDIVHLWHPRSEDRIVSGQTRTTATPEYAYNARLGRRYMVALRRDHALHDRGDVPVSEEERQRDIQNLQLDDAKWRQVGKRPGEPDWDSWWPTLEELVEGARAYRATGGLSQSVAVVVRSGGTLEVADERLGYLEQSLSSLEASVEGPIVQRVVYSDWPDEVVPRVREIADRHGYYVVGSGHHGYVTSTQRLWKYIAGRVKADFVFLAEDDFVYLKPVDLQPMMKALTSKPALRQIALLREPAYPREREPGDHILGWDRATFDQHGANGNSRLEHRNFWTMNPSLFRKDLVEKNPWPTATNSERLFGDRILADKGARVAFWGSGDAWLRHIGETRAGGPY
jgi:hypothetical protein